MKHLPYILFLLAISILLDDFIQPQSQQVITIESGLTIVDCRTVVKFKKYNFRPDKYRYINDTLIIKNK